MTRQKTNQGANPAITQNPRKGNSPETITPLKVSLIPIPNTAKSHQNHQTNTNHPRIANPKNTQNTQIQTKQAENKNKTPKLTKIQKTPPLSKANSPKPSFPKNSVLNQPQTPRNFTKTNNSTQTI